MDLSKVKPLDLTGVLGKAKKRVALVGVELEGGWIELPKGVQALVPDTSVFGNRMPAGAKHIGELPIGPVPRDAIGPLVKANYPPKIHSTCGMHVHMSFIKLFYYHLLMVPEYQETILHYLTLWAKEQGFDENHCIWKRLKGESEYCQKKFWPDAQASTKRKGHDRTAHGHRYTVIHYCGRPGADGKPMNTIECRVLPMMPKQSQAVSAIQRVIEVTDACIQVLHKNSKVEKTSGKITLPNNMIYEETIIESL